MEEGRTIFDARIRKVAGRLEKKEKNILGRAGILNQEENCQKIYERKAQPLSWKRLILAVTIVAQKRPQAPGGDAFMVNHHRKDAAQNLRCVR